MDLLVEETGVTKVVAQKMLTALTDVIASSLVAGKKGESRAIQPCGSLAIVLNRFHTHDNT